MTTQSKPNPFCPNCFRRLLRIRHGVRRAFRLMLARLIKRLSAPFWRVVRLVDHNAYLCASCGHQVSP